MRRGGVAVSAGGLIMAIGAVDIWGRIDIPGGTALAVAVTELAAGFILTLVYARRG